MAEGGFRAGAQIGKQVGGQPEVELAIGDTPMPQVGGQDRQQGIEIDPLAIPLGQAMHREGMSQVVKPGTAPSPPVRNPTSPEKLSEGVVDGQTVVRSAVGAREEGDIGRTGAQGVSIAP